MRLLEIDDRGRLRFTKDLLDEDVPPYAILSHTWGEDEVTFDDMKDDESSKSRAGYTKIEFCRQQAQKDGLRYFWVDTCCIDKANHTELSSAIISMFRWYRNAAKCYVYLPDVSVHKRKRNQDTPEWESAFRQSRWFTRGWTLQELLAPRSVHFFSREGDCLGDRNELDQIIHTITDIPLAALHGANLSDFSIDERMRWAAKRNTTKSEDKAYCLLGLFEVVMAPLYGEAEHAFIRLKEVIDRSSKEYSRRREQILDSLNNGSPFTRVNKISECSEGTFDWVFNDQSHEPYHPAEGNDTAEEPDLEEQLVTEEDFGPGKELLEWLQQGEGVFWIRGKPGSGKSTFMKYLAGLDNHNHLTLQHLCPWAFPKQPCVLSFYFWLSDTSNIQNSYHGFLCHLLYQLLSKTSAEFVSSLFTVDQSRQKRNLDNWDPKELEEAVRVAAHRVASETPLCIFIDGLDECKGSELDRVVKIVNELALQSDSKIKFCVSARPEQKVENRLRGLAHQTLELHDLTRGDIWRYVTDELEQSWQIGFSPPGEQKQQLVSKLVGYSNGVFLWAFLVTRKLCESIEIGDSAGQLREQLEELPRDMIKLYHTMLEKSAANEGNRMAEAASYFKFVLHHSYHSLNHRYVGPCSQSGLSKFVPLYERFHGKSDFRDASQTMRQRIGSLCAGMFVFEEHHSLGVEFFHRTARDFFREPYAKDILEQSKLTELESYCLLVDGVCRNQHRDCDSGLSLHEVISMIRWRKDMEETGDVHKLSYLQHIDEAMSSVYASGKGGENKNWVYELSKSGGVDGLVLDFTTLAFQTGSTELLSQQLSLKRKLGRRYKDYLLLKSSEYGTNPEWSRRFLDFGANPNATFYWGLLDRVKTSPWLGYLTDSPSWRDQFDMYTVDVFLKSGANLDERTVLLRGIGRRDNSMSPVYAQQLLEPCGLHLYSRDMLFLVVEVNAKYLLEKRCTSEKLIKVLSRHGVVDVQSHCRILLIGAYFLAQESHTYSTPSYAANDTVDSRPEFAEINMEDSAKFLDETKLDLCMDVYDFEDEQKFNVVVVKARAIWERSPKIQYVYQYLEDKGYYKKADDPAVIQGPIPMFEDEE